ncbi:sigma-70 family RNA polymerase sigma factor [Streptomyces montanus]|uniref:sigma-70 family RNA polymerase sigma factor n=1 Tax=Streptomyces montanus TaxID=2580423 RepID=UPI001FE9B3AE|nr:sigma-70 family RNA polymerase sigma factor [Streptomyces montanus]
MSDHPSGQPRPSTTRHELTVPLPQLPKAFWAFHDQYYKPYRRYAHVHLGDEHAAGELVHQVFMHLALNWAHLMEEANPAASAWALLKESVAQELDLQGRQHAMTETAVLQHVTRSVLESSRQEFAVIESALGLYPAIARLPERQFDVMVLRYVLGFSTDTTARIMGVTDATVRSHCHLARRKIARDLDIPLGADCDDEE